MSITNVNRLLNYMEASLERAKGVPFSKFVIVHKEELLDLIDRTRDVLPKEIQEANSVLKVHVTYWKVLPRPRFCGYIRKTRFSHLPIWIETGMCEAS